MNDDDRKALDRSIDLYRVAILSGDQEIVESARAAIVNAAELVGLSGERKGMQEAYQSALGVLQSTPADEAAS